MGIAKATFKNAAPYQQDKMSLPVADVDAAIPFYEKFFGFQVLSRKNEPQKQVTLGRDGVAFGLAENGGDPTQDGCVFEVDNVELALAEFRSSGLKKEVSDIKVQMQGQSQWRVFYVVAPDGLCYCIGERK